MAAERSIYLLLLGIEPAFLIFDEIVSRKWRPVARAALGVALSWRWPFLAPHARIPQFRQMENAPQSSGLAGRFGRNRTCSPNGRRHLA